MQPGYGFSIDQQGNILFDAKAGSRCFPIYSRILKIRSH
jgi:hypothetical protein